MRADSLNVFPPPMQQRLAFPAPSGPCRMALALSGLWVLVDTTPLQRQTALAHLASLGVSFRDDGTLVAFPIRELHLLSRLNPSVEVVCDHVLHALWQTVLNPPDTPATVEVLAGDLRITWPCGRRRFDEVLFDAAVPAMLSMELPIVASDEAWARLSGSSSLPVAVGRCLVTPEEYVLIEASKPQLVEAAPLSGLWRIDDTRFGLPLAYASQLDQARGFVWDGPRPPTEMRSFDLPAVPLSASARQTAQELTERLASFKAVLLVAPAQSSRRVAVCAALKAASRVDTLVVCAPWAIWAWSRAARLCGLRVRFATYMDLALGNEVAPPDSVVFDDLTLQPASLKIAASRLDSLDALRVVVASSLPEDMDDAYSLFARLKPAEFRDDVPPHVRYPVDPLRRWNEHVRPYLVRAAPSPGGFSRLHVDVLSLSPELIEACMLLESTHESRVQDLSSIVTVGTQTALSPKISSARSLVAEALQSNRTVTVLTRHPRFASLLRALSRPFDLPIVDADPVSLRPESCILVFDTTIPSVSSDVVVVADWPLSMAVLDDVVAVPQHPEEGQVIVVLHVAESIDDRLALRAARTPSPVPLGGLEVGWLLS